MASYITQGGNLCVILVILSTGVDKYLVINIIF